MEKIDPNILYSPYDTAKYLGISVVTLKRWDKRGYLVPTTRLGPRGDRKYLGGLILQFMGGSTKNNKTEA